MDQSIIVYRNPLEKYFWEHNGFGYMILFAFVMFVTFMATYIIIKRVHRFFKMKNLRISYYHEPEWMVKVSLAIAAVAAVVCCYIVNLDF